jgi:hypothetical protein
MLVQPYRLLTGRLRAFIAAPHLAVSFLPQVVDNRYNSQPTKNDHTERTI